MQADYEFKAHLVDPVTNKKKDIDISIVGGQLSIAVEGYEDMSGGEPILVDFYEDKLRVICWSDITTEDPVDNVDMEGARIEKRSK